MRHYLLLLLALCLHIAARGQTGWKYEYWFDNDRTIVKLDSSATDIWHIDADVSGLSNSLHTFHFQVVGNDTLPSSPVTRYFFKMADPFEASVRYWFDNNLSTAQEGETVGDIVLLDVSQIADGFHIVHIQVDGEGGSVSSPITKGFVKIPQTIGVDDFTCRCFIDGQLFKQEKVSSGGGVIGWDFDVSELSHGLHRILVQVVTPSGAASNTWQSFFLRETTHAEFAEMKCLYAIDGAEFYTEAGAMSDGTYHFDLDVSALEDGLHRITYMLDNGNGVSTTSQTQFFMKTPLGGSGISEYWYWLNEMGDQQANKITLPERQNPFSLISLLPVESQPIRSKLFQFRVEQDQPVIYAKNEIHVRFFEASGRFIDFTKEYVDESVRQEITDVELLEPGVQATTIKPVENTIKWYRLEARPGDSLQFKLDRAATIQLFSPSGEEAMRVSGSESVKWGGCRVKEKGFYYVALHDVTAVQGNTIDINYNHIGKYSIMGISSDRIPLGCTTYIYMRGNGLNYVESMELVYGSNIISADTIDANTTDLIASFTPNDDADENVAYTLKVTFYNKEEDEQEVLSLNNAITLESIKMGNLDVAIKSEKRVGDPYPIVVTLKNEGNVGYYGVPLNIAFDHPESLDEFLFVNFDMLLSDSLLNSRYFLAYTDSLLGKNQKGFFLPIVIPYLAPYEEIPLVFGVKTKIPHAKFNFFAWTDKPYEDGRIRSGGSSGGNNPGGGGSSGGNNPGGGGSSGGNNPGGGGSGDGNNPGGGGSGDGNNPSGGGSGDGNNPSGGGSGDGNNSSGGGSGDGNNPSGGGSGDGNNPSGGGSGDGNNPSGGGPGDGNNSGGSGSGAGNNPGGISYGNGYNPENPNSCSPSNIADLYNMTDYAGRPGEVIRPWLGVGEAISGIIQGSTKTREDIIFEMCGIEEADRDQYRFHYRYPVRSPYDIFRDAFPMPDWLRNLLPPGTLARNNCPDPTPHAADVYIPGDPNEMTGYLSESGSHYITEDIKTVSYDIEFENDPEIANSSAHSIIIENQLDPAVFDLSSFTPKDIMISNKKVELSGEQSFVYTLDMRTSINVIAELRCDYDVATGKIKWTMTSLDPMSMEPTDDIMQGILPINYSTGDGIGHVTYTVNLLDNLSHGTDVNNMASIVFDTNDPIETPSWKNTVDATAPESHITDVQMQNDSTVTVSIEATDELSGPWRYNVYVQYGSGAWFLGAENVPADTTASVKVYEGIDHGFYVIAIDSAGNYESKEPVREFSFEVFASQVDTDTKLQLAQGWNWISHNQQEALSAETLKPNARRIVSQTDELYKDDRIGWIGTLSELLPTELYKVEMTGSDDVQLGGRLFNASFRNVPLYAGWNWIGYPVANAMSPTQALQKMNAEEGDFIVGQDGMTTYSNGQWTGTLTEMQPGQGYMYRSVSNKSLFLNATAQNRVRRHELTSSSSNEEAPIPENWTVDKRKYPNVMGIVADLLIDEVPANASDWLVAAFCGAECRGLSQPVDGHLMMNVYGTGGETITFLALNFTSGEVVTVVESESFRSDVLGTLQQPYELHTGMATGITELEEGKTSIDNTTVIDLLGRPVDKTSKTGEGVYIVSDGDKKQKRVTTQSPKP